MKLFAIIHNESGEITAIAESKKLIKLYFERKSFDPINYSIYSIKEEDIINTMLIHFDELYIEHHEDIDLVLTRAEYTVIEEIIGEEIYKVRQTKINLQHFLDNYDLKSSEVNVLKDAVNVVKKISKRKRFTKLIQLDKFVAVHSPLDKIRERLSMTASKLYIFINRKG